MWFLFFKSVVISFLLLRAHSRETASWGEVSSFLGVRVKNFGDVEVILCY